MTQNQEAMLLLAQHLVHENLGEEPTGHDFFHVERVVKLAKTLAQAYPQADVFILELACWLHDIDDRKIAYKGPHTSVADFLKINHVDSGVSARVVDIIDNLSYSSQIKGKKETTLEGQIAQDADRLDALGAIGIARAFAYGGAHARLLVDPTQKASSTLDHFEEKLFRLEGLMNTPEGRAIAHERSAFMRAFVETLEKEIK